MKINTTRKTLTTIAVASLTLLTLTVSQALAQTVAQRQQQSYPPPQSGTNQPYPNRGSMRGWGCLLYTSPSPRDLSTPRMPSSA